MPAMKLCPKCQKHFSDDANFCPVDAARLVPLEAQATGTDSLTAKFDLGPRLGGTRTGAVHRATDKATGKPCVVKLVSPAVVALPGVAQRIERELKQLERVQSVGVCRVLASGKRGDEYWVATELLDGAHTLQEAITARGPIPVEQAADLIELIGEALIEAAQVGVVHRDLAPKNILFAGSDVKLINFSLPVPTSDKIPGVAEFVAPEQVEGRPVDQRSNLYSLGALYYYVLTGQTVHAGSAEEIHKQHQAGAIKPPSQLVPIPQPLENVIMRALDRSPTKRFLTVRQFVDEVTRVGHGEVIELKQTAAMGKVNTRPKAELVQTLLGVKGQFGTMPGAAGSPPPPNASPVQQLAHAAMPAPSTQPQSGPPAMPPPSGTAHGPGIPQQAPAMAASPLPATQMGMPPLTSAGPGQIAGHAQVAGPNAPTTSPWAPPGQAPLSSAAPAPTPSIPAAPVLPAAPVVAAPVVAAPQAAAAAPAGKRGAQPAAAAAGDDNKGKFRETMWFKKGDLDAQAAIAAAEERARTGKDVSADKADSKPMDERYNDDGSITRGDKEKYSLRTGSTMMMNSLDPKKNASASHTKVSEDELIGEMKGGRSKVIAAIVAGVIVLILIIVMIAR
jgi:serine/threonine protein kinase